MATCHWSTSRPQVAGFHWRRKALLVCCIDLRLSLSQDCIGSSKGIGSYSRLLGMPHNACTLTMQMEQHTRHLQALSVDGMRIMHTVLTHDSEKLLHLIGYLQVLQQMASKLWLLMDITICTIANAACDCCTTKDSSHPCTASNIIEEVKTTLQAFVCRRGDQ